MTRNPRQRKSPRAAKMRPDNTHPELRSAAAVVVECLARSYEVQEKGSASLSHGEDARLCNAMLYSAQRLLSNRMCRHGVGALRVGGYLFFRTANELLAGLDLPGDAPVQVFDADAILDIDAEGQR